MNPVSRKNPLDSAKYREKYLSNLRLQASNDQRNQNANSIFKQTGQTPSRPPDTRTTTERASDIEALKVDLRSKLGQITDGIIASQIIGELEPTQIRFAIDNWGTIEPDMKRHFGSGVPTSAFIAYLNRLISKFQLTDGVETGLQQSSGNAILMSNTQILYGLPRLQIWNTLKGVADKAQRLLGINVSPLFKEIEENINILPSLQEQQILSQIPPELKAEVIILANRMYNNVASNGEIADLIQDISLGLANRDKRYTQKAINDGIELLALDDSVIEDKNEIAFLFKTFFKQGAQDDSVAIESGDNEVPILGLEQEPYLEEIFPNPKTAVEPEIGSKQIEEANPSTLDELYRSVPRIYSQKEWLDLGIRNKKAKILFLSARLYNNPELILYNSNKQGQTPYQKGKRMPSTSKNTNEDLDYLFLSYLSQTEQGTTGEGLKEKCVDRVLPKPKLRNLTANLLLI